MSSEALLTVVETPAFLSAARKLLDEDDRSMLIGFLATDPAAGDLVQGTGGVRKLRWALEGRGKSGGARVIYFYHDKGMPLFLLTAYAKNARANISPAERNAMKALTAQLVKAFGGRRDG
ncbi:MAG: type II toxin-antitoxin system RelE/ParE family toxin [Micropepsaceae bacterium]